MKKLAQTFGGSQAPGSSSGTGSQPNAGASTPSTGISGSAGAGPAPAGPASAMSAPQGKPKFNLGGIKPQAPKLPYGVTTSDVTQGGPAATMPAPQGKPKFNLGGIKFQVPKLPVDITVSDVIQHGLPNQWSDALKWHETIQDPNRTWLSPERWEAANNLNNWFQQNKNHGIVNKISQNPQVQSRLGMMNSPLGSAASTVAPMLGKFAKDPNSFAMLLGIPGIKELFQNTIGQAGAPGLALAHSFMSGDMRNWNTLTQGLHKKADAIDKHIAKLRGR